MIENRYGVPVLVRDRAEWVSVVDAVPDEVLGVWAAKLFTMQNLAWDYVESVLDLSAQMKLTEMKATTRRIRSLKREYDRFRSKALDGASLEKERRNALRFEDGNEEDFRRLLNALSLEVGKLHLPRESAMLLTAVQQAMTVMDVVGAYASGIDEILRREYRLDVERCCLVQKEFLALYPLVPKYGGKDYDRTRKARSTTVGILLRKLLELEVGRADPPEHQ